MAKGSIKDFRIATLGSHTALQILKGAKDEGFETLCICQPDRADVYRSYGVADQIIETGSFEEYFRVEKQLMKEKKKTIIIPHGSFVSYLGYDRVNDIKLMHYGTKGILEFESNRTKEREWLLDADLKLPEIFKNPEDIDRPVIVKFHGALGGKGYFIAKTPEEFYEKIQRYPNDRDYVIQEYIVGVPLYTHYFYSRVNDELEILSFDKRYESNADSIGRISARDQLAADIETSYTIAGNIPVVVRESLLPKLFKMGQNVIEASRKLSGEGLFGPFCLEAIVDKNLEFYVFEISARIVAGTNPYVNGSPYTWLKYDVPMSTGRRIAVDIKEAIEKDCLEKVLG